MQINWQIDFWNIVIAIIFLGGIWGKLSAMETKVNALWYEFVSDRRRINRNIIEAEE